MLTAEQPVPDEAPDALPLSARLALEEPTLPGVDEVYAWARAHWRELLALLLAVLVHAAVLALGYQVPPQRSGRPGATSLSVSFAGQRSAGPEQRRTILLAEHGEKQSLAAAAPLVRPHPHRQAPPAVDAGTRMTLVAPAPPALFNWWQYASSTLGYYGPQELDVRSQPVAQENFLEGLGYLAPPGSGRIEARIYINASGGVDRVEIQQATPPGVFEQITLQQLYQLRFSPAQKDGLFVKSFKDVILTFDAEETDAAPAAVPPASIPAGNGVPPGQ